MDELWDCFMPTLTINQIDLGILAWLRFDSIFCIFNGNTVKNT